MGKVLESRSYPRDERLSGWYHTLPEATALSTLQSSATADVAVIGAGFAGLSAARRLHQNDPTLRIAVVEAQGLAWAGAGRNSGFMIDLPHELNSENYAGGESHDRQQIADNRMALAFAESAAQEYGLEEYFLKVGKYHGATNGAGLKALHEFASHLEALGEEFRLLSAAELQQVVGTDYYDGGIFTPGATLLQPAGYIRGLGRALDAKENINVYEHSPVLKVESLSDGARIATAHGRIDAGSVIFANNGHIESFGIGTNRILHLFTFASMTEELSDAQCAQLGEPDHWGLIPASPMGTTLRKLPNKRFLVRNQWTFNPDISITDRDVEHWGKQHDRCFAVRYPGLNGVGMEYRWGGPIAITLNSAPVFGEVEPNVYAATICQGLGTTHSTLLGMMLADHLTGQESPTLSALLDSPSPSRLPPRLLNQFGVPAYLKWVHWRAGRDL